MFFLKFSSIQILVLRYSDTAFRTASFHFRLQATRPAYLSHDVATATYWLWHWLWECERSKICCVSNVRKIKNSNDIEQRRCTTGIASNDGWIKLEPATKHLPLCSNSRHLIILTHPNFWKCKNIAFMDEGRAVLQFGDVRSVSRVPKQSKIQWSSCAAAWHRILIRPDVTSGSVEFLAHHYQVSRWRKWLV